MSDTAPVRADWSLEVMTYCQRVVGALIDPDPRLFETTMHRLAEHLPPPATVIERLFLHERLRAFAHSAARHLDASYHASISAPCEGRALHQSDTVWSSPAWTTTDPRAVLAAWTTLFLGAFERTHPWPAEMQVAMRLRRRLSEPTDLGTLAREAGTSRAALICHFSRRYGVSIGTYQRRARVQEGVRLLQGTGACVESIARAVGYASTKNFYAAIRRLTGLTPEEVRRGST